MALAAVLICGLTVWLDTAAKSLTLPANLAYACLQNGDLARAETEYRQLAAAPPDWFLVHFGLASIAEQRRDTNAALAEWAVCLTNTPPGSPRWAETRARLDRLQPSAKNSP